MEDLQKILNEAIFTDDKIRIHDSLLDKRLSLEQEIAERLEKGEKLDNPVYDYCIRNFTGNCRSINGERKYTTALDYINVVSKFIRAANSNLGKKIIEFYGNIPTETGEISNVCDLAVETFNKRVLYVPVRKLLRFNKNKGWEKTKEIRYEVNPEIFRYLGSFTDLVWKTDHSKETYFPGPGPEETTIHIGADINLLLEGKSFEDKTIKTIKIPAPQF